jgi:predicted DNA binding CopG/RHH family protein
MTKDKKVNFRLTSELLEKLYQSAEKKKRSLSEEIFERLTSTFRRKP